ncbi:MAG: PTS sugar transporter subunit IIA [Candidatus Krumholzibacteria bacterium]|jgi:PTS system nitrogen regulatory IIA component|nr:PTS sugar transporter subunit IIA [Candidatus Krumholzibacteria bacterium]MDP6668763.1 PTS sugar transporter subunit IIA [Candidatus Krumholzibacteria bacterium]MDP6797514.1 PTS sugar transporter subunit IIA [Candidatus Krumholzibacteria bacterium]MDP7021509.1 PTS sugar transporter subunit IIA [Candidatus Krumholzibacteria bacterium]
MTREELLTLFKPELFIPNLNATSRDEALEEMVDHAVQAGVIQDRDVILGMLKNRESLGSTGLGNEVAFPHGRSLAVPGLMTLVAISQKGVDYGAIDAKAVRLFFMFIAPPVEKENRYLPALGKVVEMVRNEDTRMNMIRSGNFEEFQSIIGGE